VRVVGAVLIAGSCLLTALCLRGEAEPTSGALRVQLLELPERRLIQPANVLVVGRSRGTVADTARRQTIDGLPPGVWMVRAQVLHRAEATIDTVEIAAAETTLLTIRVSALTAKERECVLDIRPLRDWSWTASATSACTWKANSTKTVGGLDVPFDEGVMGLDEPENANRAPGPAGLVAAVRNLRRHHPSILIEDYRTESGRLLWSWASRPTWSPDGKWIACSAYGSPAAPYNVTLVEVATGLGWTPHLGLLVGQWKWSPDARRLALELNSAWGNLTVLGFFSLEARTFTPADTLSVGERFEFSWSPDSRTIAVSKPTSMQPGHHGEEAEADLWLMDVAGSKCRLVEGKGFLAANPRWADSTHVRYEVAKRDGSEPSEPLLIELVKKP